MINQAIECAEILSHQGIEATVIRLLEVSNLPVDSIIAELGDCKHILIPEETCTGSGIHEALSWELLRKNPDLRIHAVDLGKNFVTHGSIDMLYKTHGLDGASLANTAVEVLNK